MEFKPRVLRKSYQIPSDHKAFNGHFPQSPIFPAVAQIDLVYDLLREEFADSVKSRSVRRAKFRALLKPDMRVDLELTLSREGEARWSLSGQGQIYSMGDVSFSLEAKGS